MTQPDGKRRARQAEKGESGVVGRFAPSPTGPLHAGSLVAAVGSWCFARCAGGRWLVRMEDIDTPRVVPGMADDILRTLEALGLCWDGEVLRQSTRTDAYREALEKLKCAGRAYPCGCTRAEIAAAASAPHAGDEGPPYPGTCREGLKPGHSARAWRARVEDGKSIRFEDLVLGRQEYRLNELSGDFVVLRADGIFAYQLAVVVDDAHQGINQVVRGADLVTSTPRQLLLQTLLNYPHPAYAHLPLVTGPNGAKLSKRDNAVSVAAGGDLKATGGRLVCDAMRFLGQNPPEELETAPGGEVLAWAKNNFRADKVPTSVG